MSDITEYDELADLSDALKVEKDKVAALESELESWTEKGTLFVEQGDRLSKMKKVQEAATNWDEAHPNPEGHCDDDDLRMCVTARALKEALNEPLK